MMLDFFFKSVTHRLSCFLYTCKPHGLIPAALLEDDLQHWITCLQTFPDGGGAFKSGIAALQRRA